MLGVFTLHVLLNYFNMKSNGFSIRSIPCENLHSGLRFDPIARLALETSITSAINLEYTCKV